MKTMIVMAAAVAGALVINGCSTAPSSPEKKQELSSNAQTALSKAKLADPSLQAFLDKAEGYAIFPTVGKGGAIVGGAYGRGEVYHKGAMIGYCDLSQATVGLQLGGQSYTELIVFQTPAALETFKRGDFAFAAQATAVALKSGAGANAKYTNGVAVFTFAEAGLMAEASIGGQSFTFQPL
ncbi:MAG: lipid-binding SYLF domain-containing protein [Phycisphaeraceae bacterium]|nr:lipid-binding SYLF domain-containing protein [Phycisphaeraceae bacterium]